MVPKVPQKRPRRSQRRLKFCSITKARYRAGFGSKMCSQSEPKVGQMVTRRPQCGSKGASNEPKAPGGGPLGGPQRAQRLPPGHRMCPKWHQKLNLGRKHTHKGCLCNQVYLNCLLVHQMHTSHWCEGYCMLAPLPQFAPDQLATPADIVGTVHKALHVVSAAEASFPASFVFPAGHDSHLFFTTISLIAQMVALHVVSAADFRQGMIHICSSPPSH